MDVEQVPLLFWRGASSVAVRELTGRDEQLVRETSTRTAVQLLSRLVDAPGDWHAEELTASDRDRLLAAVYRRTFGTRIDSTATCSACASLFDLTFSIDDLAATVQRADNGTSAHAQADGTFVAADGLRFRLPSAQVEMEAAALPADEAVQKLADWCVVEAPAQGFDAAALEAAIESLAPVLDLEIATSCPECRAQQLLHFDVQFYVLRAIQQERTQLTRDIHRIASAYSWSLGDILDLRRSERRAFVELIDSEQPVRRAAS